MDNEATYLPTAKAAEALGVKPRSLINILVRHGIKKKEIHLPKRVGRAYIWTADDIEMIRALERKPGRPRKNDAE